MRPALSQACTLQASFADDLDGYADAAGDAVEIWLTKLEEHLRTGSLDDVRRRAAERRLAFAAAAFQGGLLVAQGPARQAAWDQFEQRLDLCAALAIPTLIVVPDFTGPFSETDVARAQVSLQQAARAAAPRGVRLAVEFQARQTFLNNLETTASFVASIGEPNVGICLDLFQFSIGPSKTEDLACLTPDNLFHVQLSDLADTPRELAADADRILPGDGDFHFAPLVQRLRAIGYAGYVSLELFNPVFWRVPPQQVADVGLTSLRTVLGLASQEAS